MNGTMKEIVKEILNDLTSSVGDSLVKDEVFRSASMHLKSAIIIVSLNGTL